MDIHSFLNFTEVEQKRALDHIFHNWKSLLAKLPAHMEDIQYLLTQSHVHVSLKFLESLMIRLAELLPRYVVLRKLRNHKTGNFQLVLQYFSLGPLQVSATPLISLVNEPQMECIDDIILQATNTCSFANTQEQELIELLSGPTSLEVLAREHALSEEPVPYIDACPFSSKECAKLRTKPCNKIHFQSIIRNNTDISLGDCSYLNTCFKGKNCRYVHYHISLPEKVKEPIKSIRPVKRSLQMIGENVCSNKVRLNVFRVNFIFLTTRLELRFLT